MKNAIDVTMTPHRHRQATHRTNPLALAVRSALAVTGIALLSAGSAYATPCSNGAETVCDAAADAALIAVPQDLSTVAGSAPPSAVKLTYLTSDNTAITTARANRVINTEDISKDTQGDVVGLEAVNDAGDINVVNTASITVATGDAGLADGIFSAGNRTNVLNTGSITAIGYSWVAGIENQSYGSARIRNAGSISIGASNPTETGPLFSRSYGIVSSNIGDGGTLIENDGVISGRATAYGIGISAYDGGAGGLKIINSGDISVLTAADNPDTRQHDPELGMSTGVAGSTNMAGSHISFKNEGSIDVRGTLRATNGVVLTAFGADSMVTVVNAGTINVLSDWVQDDSNILQGGVVQYSGTGFHVFAEGDVGINNTVSGKIFADGDKNSIAVSVNSGNGSTRINNDGFIESIKGISAEAGGGDITVRSAGVIAAIDTAVLAKTDGGDIHATNLGIIEGGVIARLTSRNGAVRFVNAGTIKTLSSEGMTSRIKAVDLDAGSNVVAINHGTVEQEATTLGYSESTAMAASSNFGDSVVHNSSSGIIKQAPSWFRFGGVLSSFETPVITQSIALAATATQGSASASNAGILEISGATRGKGKLAIAGIVARTYEQGRAISLNANTLKITADDLAPRPEAVYSPLVGDHYRSASGVLAVSNAGEAIAMNTGRLSILTQGTRSAARQPEVAGIMGRSETGTVTLANSGSIEIQTSTTGAVLDDQHGGTAIDGGSTSGNVSVLNSGSVIVNGIASTGALAASGGGAVAMKNTGMFNVSSSHGNATGLAGNINGGTLSIANAGIINVTAAAAGVRSAGILASATDGKVVALNSGMITATAAGGSAFGMLGSGNGNANLVNTGKIVADTAIQAGDGVTTIGNYGILVGGVGGGANNDTINNHLGASWDMSGRTSSFGAGNDNVRNMGFLLLKDSRFDFGEGSNGFSNTGTIKLTGTNLIDLGTTGSARFTNAGLLDFTNGKAGDSLAIAGHFGGVGNINLDVDLTAGIGDWLSVSGVAATGTQQKLNIALLDGLPTSDALNQPLQLVQVAGNANPNAFVPGQVLGISPADFLKLDMSMAVEKIAGTKGGNYLLSITPKVAGLNASGTLVSAAAMGVDSLLSSTSGNWRERAAMIHSSSALPGLKGVTPWVRGFRDTGGMSSNNMVGNFGQAHSANLNQDNSGSEIGFNLDAGNGFSVGATVAKSEAKQYLAQGYGTDTLQGSSVGMYATWNSQAGAYIDASVRGMQFDAYLDTVAGRQQGQGNAHMLNVESGRTWTLRNGLNVEPQAQFTSTKVSGMRVQGDKAVMQTEASNWQRGRIGVSLWKSYRGVSGWNVTPYGQISALHTLEGRLDYNINRDFHGQLNNEGTMAMFKFGINAAKGRFKLGSALNWQSGNQLDSGLGVQTQLNYAW